MSRVKQPGRMQAQSPLAAWYALVRLGTPWYPLVPLGTSWYPLVPLGTPWYPLVPLGTPWYPLAPLGTPWRSCFCLVDGIVEPSAGADSPLSHQPLHRAAIGSTST